VYDLYQVKFLHGENQPGWNSSRKRRMEKEMEDHLEALVNVGLIRKLFTLSERLLLMIL
jgi:hypothetical protein